MALLAIAPVGAAVGGAVVGGLVEAAGSIRLRDANPCGLREATYSKATVFRASSFSSIGRKTARFRHKSRPLHYEPKKISALPRLQLTEHFANCIVTRPFR